MQICVVFFELTVWLFVEVASNEVSDVQTDLKRSQRLEGEL